jgi:glycosyltransferase involved in cell wall biosynthesis
MKPRLSLLIALLDEADNLQALHAKIDAAVADLPVDTEILFIDDGSTDGSWREIQRLALEDDRVRGIRLSRNYGNHRALLAGLHHATGDGAMNLAADLQNPPELIGQFVRAWQSGAEIVLGVREARADAPSVRRTSALAYWVIRALGGSSVPSGGIDLFLVDRRVIHEIRKFSGRNISIISLIMGLGFGQARIGYSRPERVGGRSKWTLAKKLALFLDSVFAASGRPLLLILGAGVLAAALGFAGALATLLLFGLDHWQAGGLGILLGMAGLILIGLAIVGEYVRRASEELGGCPAWIVSEATPVAAGPARLERELLT